MPVLEIHNMKQLVLNSEAGWNEQIVDKQLTHHSYYTTSFIHRPRWARVPAACYIVLHYIILLYCYIILL